MSKKLWKKCPRAFYKAARFIETNEDLLNPCRGWYQIHTFKLGEELSLVDREYTLNNRDSVAFALIDISKYRSQDLDEEAKNDLRSIFSFFRDYRLELIVRVVYDTEGRCALKEPSDEDQVKRHIEQIFEILNEFKDVIFVYQGLLIGNWGEMHSSKFLSPSRLRNLADTIVKDFPDVAFLAVRRPAYVRIMFPEGEDIRQKKVGIFDDAIMASPTHLGTFGEKPAKEVRREMSWLPEEELKYVSELCDRVPYGGEALWSDEEDSLEHIRGNLEEIDKYFARLHVTYLNRIHDARFINNLKELTWNKRGLFKGMDGYEYIGRHLGYRFVLRKVKCHRVKEDASMLRWDITIANEGFARAFFECGCYIEGDDEFGERTEYDIKDWVELNKIPSKTEHTFVCMTPAITGLIYLRFTKLSTGEAVYFANKKPTEDFVGSKLYLGKISK
ncbi:MAG: DUF4874 domain-containing protein [Lachnospiraceae bacterium]|nr:DUF4874 domain-containing protein [Lachnospiraceae bacterium]